ncbi:MAG: Mov34/MPN/PAD-1 family protein [Anaerolineales bacterium]|nr:Mov34/MPN/PAD-1 family protein [Anaerolineales bacterium]
MKIDFGEPIEFEIPIADFPLKDFKFKSLSKHAYINVFVLKSAYDEMIEHVNIDKNIECGGILVGYPFRDPDVEEVFIVIVGVIRDISDDRSVVHFTVTPKVIAKTREILEEKYPDLIAVGWYHSHPGHGVFLSGQDMTIVRGIYNEEWNLAWVIDPIRQQEGIFYGANGDPIVKNKSSNPLFSSSKQTWFSLEKYPQCIKDLQKRKLKITNKKTEYQPKNNITTKPLVSKREEEEEEEKSKPSKRLSPYVLISLGIVVITVLAAGVFTFYYFGSSFVNPTATPLTLPIVLTPASSFTPTITVEPASTPTPLTTPPSIMPSNP